MKTRSVPTFVLAALVAAPVVAAQTPTAPNSQTQLARTQLIRDAERARAEGNHPRALDLVLRAGAIEMTPSLQLFIATEHNALGHTLDAFSFASQCQRSAQANASLSNRQQILAACDALVESLRSRVGSVTVHTPEPAPAGFQVRVQGGSLTSALWGVPYPVLPGTIVVEALAADGATFRTEVVVHGGANREVTVALTRAAPPPAPVVTPATASVAPAPAAATTVAAVTPATPRPSAPAPVTRPTPARGAGAGPWVLVGAGVASLGAAAGVYLGLRQSALDEVASQCGTAVCAPTALAPLDRARAYTVVAEVALGVGVAAVAGGVVWYLLARPHGESGSARVARWGVAPTVGGMLVSLQGAL